MAPLQSVALKACSASEAYVAYLKEQTIGELANLRTDFKRKAKTLLDKLSIAQRDLLKFQTGLTKALGDHEAGQEDPWLTEQRLKQAASSFLAEKERFLVSLQAIYAECEKMISEVGQRAANLASEALLVRGKKFHTFLAKQTTLLAEQLGDSSVRLNGIDQMVEWQHALIKHRLDFEWTLSSPPLDAFLQHLYKQTDYSVYRQGPVQIKMGAFRQWTTITAYLTNTGFLHLGDIPIQPTVSIALHADTVIAGQNDKELCITLPAQPGIFGRGERKHVLRFSVDTEMVEWLLAIRTIRDEVTLGQEVAEQNQSKVTEQNEVAERIEVTRQIEETRDEVPLSHPTTPIVIDEENPWA